MRQYTNSAIILSLLFFSWFFGEYIYPYFSRVEAYVVFMVIIFAVLWTLRRKIGWQYVWVGIMGFLMVVVFFVLTSPHRVTRVKSWLDMLFS